MKKIILISTLFIFALNAYAQTTVTIRPHFNGIESLICRADSTNPDWSFTLDQYADTVIDSSKPILSYMAWTSSGCPIFTRSLIQFANLTDTSIIPAGSVITSAQLYLYGIPSTPTGDFGNSTYPGSPYTTDGQDSGWIYELASDFSPATNTWNTQPDIKHTDSAAIPPSTSQWNSSDTIDVTSLVTDLLATGNTGFELRMRTEVLYRERLFGSSRYADSTAHPSLQVTYVRSINPDTNTAVHSINNLNANLSIYPNPVYVTLSACVVVTNSTNMSITISNILGQIIFTTQQNFHEGVNTIKIPVEDFAPGMYIMDVFNQSTELKQKFVKQ